jgi:hypothetical protein
MNIVEGEHDPTFWLMTLITLILVLASLRYLTPFFIECLYRLNDWWINYYWIPCLPCGALP